MYNSTNKGQIQRIKWIQRLLDMTDEEFMERINPHHPFDEEDEPWFEFSEYENGNRDMPDSILNRVLLVAARNNIDITPQWLILGNTI